MSEDGPITEAIRQHGIDALEAQGLAKHDAAKWLSWRTGRKVGRTIYAQVGKEPSDDDMLIGVMDTSALADEAVRAHNVTLTRVQQPDFLKATS